MRSVLLALLLSCACVAGAQEDVQKLLASAAQYQALGFRQKAIQDLEQALGLVSADTPLAATVRGALGQAYLRAGDVAKAQPLLEQSLAGARELKLPAIACAALNDLGQLHLGQDRRAEALAAFRESMGLARQSGAPLVFAAAATSAAPLLPPQERAPVLHEASNLVTAAPDSMWSLMRAA